MPKKEFTLWYLYPSISEINLTKSDLLFLGTTIDTALELMAEAICYNRLARMVLQWELKGRERQKILISLRDMTQFTLVPCSSHQNSWNVWMLNPQKTWKTIGFKPSPYPHVVAKF